MPPKGIAEPPTYFVDADLAGHIFLRILAENGVPCVSIRDAIPHENHSPPTDEEWIRYCAKNGLVALTHDKRILVEWADELNDSGARVIILRGTCKAEALARNFVACRNFIEQRIRKVRGGFVARLQMPTPSDLKKRNPRGRFEFADQPGTTGR